MIVGRLRLQHDSSFPCKADEEQDPIQLKRTESFNIPNQVRQQDAVNCSRNSYLEITTETRVLSQVLQQLDNIGKNTNQLTKILSESVEQDFGLVKLSKLERNVPDTHFISRPGQCSPT